MLLLLVCFYLCNHKYKKIYSVIWSVHKNVHVYICYITRLYNINYNTTKLLVTCTGNVLYRFIFQSWLFCAAEFSTGTGTIQLGEPVSFRVDINKSMREWHTHTHTHTESLAWVTKAGSSVFTVYSWNTQNANILNVFHFLAFNF